MKYINKRKIYKRKWNRKHRRQLNRTRKLHRKLKKRHIKNLEDQIKLIPKLEGKISNLQNELTKSRSKLINESKLKKQINQFRSKVQFLDRFKTALTKDYILIKFSSNNKSHKISHLENELGQFNRLKSENKSLASRCSSAASIIKAGESKSADKMVSDKSFLMGKIKKDFLGNGSKCNGEFFKFRGVIIMTVS